MELPAIPEPAEIRYLTLPEVDRLLAHTQPGECQELDHALYMTAVMTGLRQGELIALRWRDVDWTANRIRVRRNYSRGEFGTPKSRRSSRSVPMIDKLADELRTVYGRTHRRDPDDLVFAHPATGNVLAKCSVYCRMQQTLKAAGPRHQKPLPRPPPHLRHPHGRHRRPHANPPRMDGTPRHGHHPALRRLRAEPARRRDGRGGVRAGRERSWRGGAAAVGGEVVPDSTSAGAEHSSF
jgi:integrase